MNRASFLSSTSGKYTDTLVKTKRDFMVKNNKDDDDDGLGFVDDA